jgi:hypothetical protein
VVEVNNTFGERHCYLLDAPRYGVELKATKVFHVSPFCKVEGGYRFRFMRTQQGDAERTVVRIDYDDAAGPLLQTSVSGTLEPATAAAIRRALWRYPAMTLACRPASTGRRSSCGSSACSFFQQAGAARHFRDPLNSPRSMNTTTASRSRLPRAPRPPRAPRSSCCSACSMARSPCSCPTALHSVWAMASLPHAAITLKQLECLRRRP